ncbi:proton-coupled amino acid transporter-like protein CG1139 [Homalodisca vitripennis]|uniref:proton-coupled amino acid transporter-like protein CG1139 n=1 Tax=Homalodisca vitripennis TaxID=197043 RepID=UPI001EE9CB79|nr:proton-coupled amino acid transporter-like protein CG1139 [Homalodisca vitripennis]
MAEDATSFQAVKSTASETSTKRKGFISPTSSFVEFEKLETEYFSEEGRQGAASYNPHIHRKIKKPVTNFETATHLLKGSVGAGILAMPKAFDNSGIIIGLVGTVLLGIIVIYAMDTLFRMQYIQCQRLRVPFLTLPRSMKIGLLNGPRPLRKLAWLAPCMVDFFLVTYQLGICTAYVIFIAHSLKHIAEPRVVENLDDRVYLLVLFIPVVLINYIRNLKLLTPVSFTANILEVIALIFCFYYIFAVGPFKYEETNMVSSVKTWPLFVGTVLFALEAVGVLIALEHNMKTPQDFLGKRGIFPWCLAAVISLYVAVGFFGYIKYGKGIEETIIASLPKDEWLALTTEGIYAIAIYGTHPLQCYVSLEILWGNYIVSHIKNENLECYVEYTLRTGAVLVTFLGALLIPHVDIMISLVGAFCLSTLGMAFPFLLELCTLWPDELGCCYYILFKDIFFILMGIAVLILGTYVSLHTYISS